MSHRGSTRYQLYYSRLKHEDLTKKPKNLVRFAHNWNDGMMEYWSAGKMGLKKEK
jgi:hypothetical protein